MSNLYFSPKGRIGPSVFQKSAITLIVIGFVLNILPLLSFGLGAIFGLLGIAMIWPWLCIWIKRLHDAGKSGWMVLLVILVMIILSVVSTRIVYMLVGFDQTVVQEAAMSAGGDFMAMMKASAEATKPTILPSAIAGVIVQFIIVFGANKILSSDPEENQYGPTS